MNDEDWNSSRASVLGMCLNGQMDEFDERGQQITGTTLLFFFSAENRNVQLRLPRLAKRQFWFPLFDTAKTAHPARRCHGGSEYTLGAHSCAAFELRSTLVRRVQQLITNVNDTMPRPVSEPRPTPQRKAASASSA
jgi:hypothetical protein